MPLDGIFSNAKIRMIAERKNIPIIHLLSESITDVVVPGICVNDKCNNIIDVEPDQKQGFCENCKTNTIKSVLIIADLL